MTISVCEFRLIIYCILVIVDLSMCKKKKKKRKRKKNNKRKKRKKLHLCIILYHYPLGSCMEVTPYSTEYIYDGESSYVSSSLNKMVQHLRENGDILILGYLDSCHSITPFLLDVTSLHAMM